ncbi:uncharacterized protein LOC112572809 [Pomacea canaliculata]|uniref:uncharacterized protein LOC112572809 n=1 Tax=Pomacea canaliculata TaxID=400727 RepID=UPI000D73C2AE|nr:uncharacterized protein LOC112572809 [Pomacea canaliculata]
MRPPRPLQASCPIDEVFDDVRLECRKGAVCGQRPVTGRQLSPPAAVVTSCLQSATRQTADPQSCKNYYICPNGTLALLSCPEFTLFDVVSNRCIPFTGVDCQARPVTYSADQLSQVCSANPFLLIPSSQTCNSYYNCSRRTESGSPAYYQECPYLQLFDVNSRRCLPYSMVTCGTRGALKYRCQLSLASVARHTARPAPPSHPTAATCPTASNRSTRVSTAPATPCVRTDGRSTCWTVSQMPSGTSPASSTRTVLTACPCRWCPDGSGGWLLMANGHDLNINTLRHRTEHPTSHRDIERL